jgi:hypothetical protein
MHFSAVNVKPRLILLVCDAESFIYLKFHLGADYKVFHDILYHRHTVVIKFVKLDVFIFNDLEVSVLSISADKAL